MTVQEYIDELSDRLLADAMDGTMPPEIRREVQHLLTRIQAEMDEFGHVQTRLTPQILAMPWDDFLSRIERLKNAH